MSFDPKWIAHAVTALVAGIGGLLMKRTLKQLDDKADKVELGQLRQEMHDRWGLQDKFWERQEAMHAENRQRLDRILERMAGEGND